MLRRYRNAPAEPEAVSREEYVSAEGRRRVIIRYADGTGSDEFVHDLRYHIDSVLYWGKPLLGYLIFAAVWLVTAHAIYGDKVPLWFLGPAIAVVAAALTAMLAFSLDFHGELRTGTVGFVAVCVCGATLLIGLLGAGAASLF